MAKYGIVNYDGQGRFEVLNSKLGKRVAVFDDLADAELFRLIKEDNAEDSRKLAASRLVLLWNIEDAINNPDTSDEEKWQSIREWLEEQRELTLATGEDEDTLVAQREAPDGDN